MAVRPIHPEVQARADELLVGEIASMVDKEISLQTAQWTIEKLRGPNALILEEKVERIFESCVTKLKEGLTDESREEVARGLHALRHYPAILAELMERVHELSPNIHFELEGMSDS